MKTKQLCSVVAVTAAVRPVLAQPFTDVGFVLGGVDNCSLAWGDYDNDGDLDLALAGYSNGTRISKIYDNDGGVFNTAPAAPTGLSATVDGPGEVTFSWDAASDAETPANGLSYNLRVGTSPGDEDVFCGMADLSSGLRRLPATGNAQQRLSWPLQQVPCGGTLYWSVQAVDTAFAGSAWVAEQSVLVASDVPVDFDGDCDVDVLDYIEFESCASGPDVPQNDPACADAKLDAGDDIDQDDFAVFQRCYSGEGNPADPTCAD